MKSNKYDYDSTEICSIVKCEKCGAYNLDYRYLRIHIDIKGLKHMLTVLYQYDQLDEVRKNEKPFRVKYGLILITVYHMDFGLFKTVLEKVVLNELTLPETINTNYLNN